MQVSPNLISLKISAVITGNKHRCDSTHEGAAPESPLQAETTLSGGRRSWAGRFPPPRPQHRMRRVSWRPCVPPATSLPPRLASLTSEKMSAKTQVAVSSGPAAGLSVAEPGPTAEAAPGGQLRLASSSWSKRLGPERGTRAACALGAQGHGVTDKPRLLLRQRRRKEKCPPANEWGGEGGVRSGPSATASSKPRAAARMAVTPSAETSRGGRVAGSLPAKVPSGLASSWRQMGGGHGPPASMACAPRAGGLRPGVRPPHAPQGLFQRSVHGPQRSTRALAVSKRTENGFNLRSGCHHAQCHSCWRTVTQSLPQTPTAAMRPSPPAAMSARPQLVSDARFQPRRRFQGLTHRPLGRRQAPFRSAKAKGTLASAGQQRGAGTPRRVR